MKEQLASFETALLAKEKGFTITECFYGISSSMIYDVNKKAKPSYQNTQEDEVDAPTQSLLQKWLREKHNIIVTSLPYEDEIPECEEEKRQTLWEDETIDCRETPWLREITTYTYYHSYEKALEIGLQEALKLI